MSDAPTEAERLHYSGVLFEAMHKRGLVEAVERGPDGLPTKIEQISNDPKLNAEAFEEAARLTGLFIDPGAEEGEERLVRIFGGRA